VIDGRDTASTFLKSRLVLVVGFGSLLAITALSGFDALRVLGRFRTESDQIRRQFLLRNRVLNNIRAEVYISGTYVRDYLLEPDGARASRFRANLESAGRKMEIELASYSGLLEPADSAHYEELRTELAQYWRVLEPILTWDARKRQAEGYSFLRDEVFPRRTAMLEVASGIADLNEQQLNSGDERVSTLLEKFQDRLSVTLFAALALGLGLAVLSARKILQLEAHAQARYREVAEARQQLTNLSARLVEAQETERRSLSRELHDEVGQSLSAALLELRTLFAALDGRPDEKIRKQAEVVKRLIEGSVRSVRSMALLLRPSMLDDLGLNPALRWQAREVSKRTSMDVTVETELESEELPDEYKTCIYRVVQEALHNCSRHSDATTVRVRVQYKAGALVLSIQDDGRGFDVSQSKGLGLLGIEERVAQLDGTLQVHSGPGIGTILTVELPYTPLSKDPSEADSHPVSG
jgi:signal transduction histidine kinase